MTDCKKWYHSKTMWVAIATMGIGITGGAVALLPVLAPVVSAQTMAWTLFGVGIVNVVLRSITNKGIV